MQRDRLEKAIDILNEIIEKYDLNNNIPVDLRRICVDEGIILQETDNYKDGKLEYSESLECYKIMYVKNKYSERHNFTIAHELGHYFLKHLNEIEGNVIYRQKYDDIFMNVLEEEANYFAAGLLLPQEVFRNKYNKLKKMGLTFDVICTEISNEFDVSTAVVENRFRNRRLY